MWLQRGGGYGTAWLEISGELIQKDLAPGEVLRVHPGHVGAFHSSVSFTDHHGGPGIKNTIFGGDGIFLAQFGGPRHGLAADAAYLAPRASTAHYMPGDRRNVPRAAGAGLIGGIVGSILSGGE